MTEEQKKKKCVGVCMGGSCYNNGSEQLMEYLEELYGTEAGQENEKIALDYAGCLGQCESINIEVDGDVYTEVTKDNVQHIIEHGEHPDQNHKKSLDDLDALLEEELAGL
jgi:NADH:ubiquinone oxidoreductase subunit E